MPQFIMDTSGWVGGQNWDGLSPFEQGFIEAMFFTDTGADSVNPGDLSFGDIDPAALATIRDECNRFVVAAGDDLDEGCDQGRIDGYDMTSAGRDFWFSRNGSGVGFWSRDELSGGIGDKLDEHAEGFRTLDIYTGDDGRLHVI